MESTDGRRLVPPGLITAVLAISLAAIFFKKAQPTHPLASAGIRLAIAAVLLSPFTLRAARAGRLPPRIVRAGLLAGLLYGVHFGAWVASLELTTIAASVTLVTITPLFLAIAGVITGTDRPSGAVWLALGVAVVGITIIGGTDLGTSRDALIGDALACLGSIAIAGYLLLARRLGKDLDVLAFTGIATAVGAIALLGTGAAAGVDLRPASLEALGYLALAALIPQMIGHSLLTWALRHTSPTVVGLATVGEPVGSTILGVLILAEIPSGLTVLGCCITLCAVILALAAGASEGSRARAGRGALEEAGSTDAS